MTLLTLTCYQITWAIYGKLTLHPVEHFIQARFEYYQFFFLLLALLRWVDSFLLKLVFHLHTEASHTIRSESLKVESWGQKSMSFLFLQLIRQNLLLQNDPCFLLGVWYFLQCLNQFVLSLKFERGQCKEWWGESSPEILFLALCQAWWGVNRNWWKMGC